MFEEARLILDEQGNVLDRIGYWIDITKQKQAEKDLLLVNRELKDFTSIVVHDLKAPFCNISNLVKWLLRDSADDLSEEGKVNLNLLGKQTTHMDRLIDGCLIYFNFDDLLFQFFYLTNNNIPHSL